ncbi:enoyl-CoA hydratase-related protein [Pontitalea aquivivens]|uniref:enoyl-CoA hydratase-related protein n=1 Tax=Pontitalea aquivivens TaxID=3388663 RepID=UPI0039708C40
MQEDAIRVERSARGHATIVLNRPDRLNTLSIGLRQALADVVRELEADPDVHVLILTGAGKVFSAGLDITEWESASLTAAGAYVHDPVAALTGFSGPVIGAINGLCLTGGLELALACDFLVAAESASFADSHCQVGLLPGWGGSVRLSRRIGPARAMEMALTARFLSATEALSWGLVNHVVPDGEVRAKAEELALQMMSGVPEARAAYKRLLQRGLALPFEEALQMERAASVAANQAVDKAELDARLSRLKGRGTR